LMGNDSCAESSAPATCTESDRFKPLALPSVATLLRNTGPSPHANEGNVDSVFSDPATGFAFVADGVGHSYATTGLPARQRDLMHASWDGFAQRMSAFLTAQPQEGCTVTEIEMRVRAELYEVSQEFCTFGKSSTFSIAMALTKCSSDTSHWILCVSLADSGLVLVPPSNQPQAEQLVNFDSSVLRNIEIGGDVRGAEFTLHHVVPGALVLGLTDGTLDALGFEPTIVPPPPRAGSAPAESAAPVRVERYGKEWMTRVLDGVSAALAKVSKYSEEVGPPEPEVVLENIFHEAMQITSSQSSTSSLQPDDCASFAFYVPSNTRDSDAHAPTSVLLQKTRRSCTILKA